MQKGLTEDIKPGTDPGCYGYMRAPVFLHQEIATARVGSKLSPSSGRKACNKENNLWTLLLEFGTYSRSLKVGNPVASIHKSNV